MCKTLEYVSQDIVTEQTMIDVPRICLCTVGEQYGHKVVCICGLTPQNVVIE